MRSPWGLIPIAAVWIVQRAGSGRTASTPLHRRRARLERDSRQILAIADELSAGIMQQFPAALRLITPP
jgi:hypothetical protein